MDRSGWQELVDNLRGTEYPFGQNAAGYSLFHRVEFDAGLTDAEVITVEGRFSFQFPPDLREFLQTALPRGPRPAVPRAWPEGNRDSRRMCASIARC